MKFAPPRSRERAPTREERLLEDRRSAVRLQDLFPSLERLSIELTFEGGERDAPSTQTHTLHPAAAAFFRFPCPYANCSGEFDLRSAIEAAVAGQLPERHVRLECGGARTGERLTGRLCRLLLQARVLPDYRRDTLDPLPRGRFPG